MSREPSQFTAALAHIVHLRPPDALEQLQRRAIDLQATIAALEEVERGVGALVGRLAVLEVEYERALLQTQVDWLAAVVEDVRIEKLTWAAADPALVAVRAQHPSVGNRLDAGAAGAPGPDDDARFVRRRAMACAFAPLIFTVSLPLLLLSGVLLPLSFAPAWLKAIAAANPLAYAVDASRASFNDQLADPSIGIAVAIMAILASIAVTLAARAFGRAVA